MMLLFLIMVSTLLFATHRQALTSRTSSFDYSKIEISYGPIPNGRSSDHSTQHFQSEIISHIVSTCSFAECVGEICSCKHVHNLPNTFVGANLESTKLKIYWNITTPTAELLESEIHVDSVFIRWDNDQIHSIFLCECIFQSIYTFCFWSTSLVVSEFRKIRHWRGAAATRT